MSQFVVHITARDQPVRWIKLGETGNAHVASGSLEEAARQSLGLRIVVLLPSEDILLTQANIPTQNKQKVLTALPYALEDQVAGDVEGMHFCAGERNADGLLAVAVCARSYMDNWLDILRAAGLSADVIIPDCLALPLQDGSWSLLEDGQRLLLHSTDQQGYSFAINERDSYLSFMQQDAKDAALTHLRYYQADASSAVPQWDDVEVETISAAHGLLGLIAEHGLPNKLMNLRQGDYSRREQLGKLWRPWVFAASVAAAWFVLTLGVAAYENSQLRSEKAELSERSVAIYKEIFPEARNVPNPRAQMEQKLKQLRGSGSTDEVGFLNLLSASAPSFKNAKGVVMKNLRYKNGALDIDLEAPSLQAIDRLKQTLGRAKLSVEIQSAASKNNKVQGRLQIKRGEA
jgi:general secretion pathway protein L